MRILVLSDGKPGHFNQSRGVVKALGLRSHVVCDWITLKLRCSLFRKLLHPVLNRSRMPFPVRWLRVAYRSPPLTVPAPDLIVSAGGNTLFANIWLARWFRCQNLFVGDVRGISEHHFSGIITRDAGKSKHQKYIVSMTPTRMDPREITATARRFRAQRGLETQRLWAMLIGGDGGGYRYRKRDWDALADAMERIAYKERIKWMLTTSRRTGRKVESLLASRLPPQAAADVILYSQDGQREYDSFLGSAERIFCTEDSAMMISEAVAFARPVYTLRPEHSRPDVSNLQVLQSYEEANCISRLAICDLRWQDFSQSRRSRNVTDYPIDELADKLAHWLERAT
jgi:mitochondrial fission protein ELM1